MSNTPLELFLGSVETVISRDAAKVFSEIKHIKHAKSMNELQQIIIINATIRKLLYLFSGKTNTNVTNVMTWIADDLKKDIWMDTINRGVMGYIKEYKIIETIRI